MADAMKLLPCPFCGNGAVVGRSERAVTIGCDFNDCPSRECYAAGNLAEEPDVIAAWNRRASPPAREEAPAEGAGFEMSDAEMEAVSTRAVDGFASDLRALRNRTSEPEAGAVANDNPLTFGMGALVVNTGKFGGDNAVFIAKATAPGKVGAYTGNSAFDRHTLQPGELVMIFPTAGQVQVVADALVGAHPAPATADKLKVAVEALSVAEDELDRVSDEDVTYEPLMTKDALCVVRQALAALNEQPQ